MILYAHGEPQFVLDAKYKLLAHQDDIYQTIAYCHALNVNHAVLIHPANEKAPAGVVTTRGRNPISILYVALDLGSNLSQLVQHTQALERSLANWVMYKNLI